MTHRQALEACFTSPAQYARLTAYVRHRGVCEDPEDVVQQAICDALAVEAVPTEQEEIPRWFQTIVSRRVVDRFRRQRRIQTTELGDVPSYTDPEARDLLCRIDHEIADDARQRTLGWLLREHAGESLKEIASELSLDAAALRQRICRLRRELRGKFLVALAALLLVWVGAAAYRALPVEPWATSSASSRAFDGNYVLVDATKPEFKSLHLEVALKDGRATLTDRSGVVRATLSVEVNADATLTIRAGTSRWHVTVQRLGSDRLRLSSDRGQVTLERVAARRAFR